MSAAFSRWLRTDWFGPLLVVLIASAVIGTLSPAFLSPLNFQVLLLAIAVNTLVAFAQMIIIAIGQMNLSVGAIGGLAAISFAGMMQVWGLPPLPAAIAAVGIGCLAGVANGVFISATGISAFVITLASLSIYKGINLGITKAQPFYGVPESVKLFGGTTFAAGLPWLILPTAAVILAMWYLLNRQSAGRYLLAIGGNQHAAELSGISVARSVILAHGLSGALAALAGVLLVARLQIGQPTIGDDWLILSFAAPVIGGAVLAGGHVSVAGTVLGVVVVAIITQALVLFAIDPFLVQVVLGLLILWAVGVNRLRELRVEALAKRV
jgi:ribose transport system permease protein